MTLSKTHQKLAHELVAETAKEMAAVFYEELAKDNDFYKFYPKQQMFINREWHRFIQAAKETLALMLANSATPEWQKERIHDALVKHATLPGNIDKRVATQLIAQGHVPKLSGLDKVH